jgi:HAD superfamily hydrolase (TIGR01549 family)
MLMEFTIHGHENTLSVHKTTLEFTKESHLTQRGDCILGVNANFSAIPKGKKLQVEITAGTYSDTFSGYYNTSFSSKEEMVLRTSNFEDGRTYMTKCNKASKDISRNIVKYLQNPKHTATIRITPLKIKNIIFDFDNTLEDWTQYELQADKLLIQWVIDLLREKGRMPEGLTKTQFAKIFNEAKYSYLQGHTQPKYYGRDYWLRKTLRNIHRRLTTDEITHLVKKYWTFLEENVTLFPETIDMLKKVKNKYNTYILSDSDGNKNIKMKRINKFHLKQYFKAIITSDDTKFNKPDRRGEEWLLKKAKLNPHETMFVGDHPEKDHITSKNLGMTTVWVKQGEHQSGQYKYVDFEINHINEVLDVLKKL